MKWRMNKNVYIVSGTLTLLFFFGMIFFVLHEDKSAMDDVSNNGVNAELSDSVKVYENIRYGGKERNLLDIYLPFEKDKSKYNESGVILFIHGGSWTSGDKSSMADDCKLFASKGYVTATMNYSFLDISENEKTDFKTMLTEIATALSVIKDYLARFGVNVTKAALSGYSAGAHLAMLYAYSMSEYSPLPILFVQSKAGPADYRTFALSDMQEVLGKSKTLELTPDVVQSEEFVNMLQFASPVFHVNKNAPPTLLAYGKQDSLVTWENVVSLLNAFSENNIEYALIEYPNSGHGLDKDTTSILLCNEKMADFARIYFGY